MKVQSALSQPKAKVASGLATTSSGASVITATGGSVSTTQEWMVQPPVSPLRLVARTWNTCSPSERSEYTRGEVHGAITPPWEQS